MGGGGGGVGAMLIMPNNNDSFPYLDLFSRNHFLQGVLIFQWERG